MILHDAGVGMDVSREAGSVGMVCSVAGVVVWGACLQSYLIACMVVEMVLKAYFYWL